MSKKTKRQMRRETGGTISTPAATRQTEFAPDYTPIIKDLRRIATLATSFIVILVALSFFLR